MLRLTRAGGATSRFVLPGPALGAASWLGHLPPDYETIAIAAAPGFVLERVGLRGSGSIFAECLTKRPLRAVGALRALVLRDERRWRDSLRGACAATPFRRYPAWKATRLRACAPAGTASGKRIRLVLPASAAQADAVARSVASLRAQAEPNWSLRVAWTDDAPRALTPASDPRIAAAPWDPAATARALCGEAELFGLLRPGDILSPDALSLLAAAFSDATLDLAYADEEIGASRPAPRLKPDWSPDLARVAGYVGAPALVSRALFSRLPEEPAGSPAAFATAFDLVVCRARRAVHIPRILCRREDAVHDFALRGRLLERHLRASRLPASAEIREGVLDLRWHRPDPPPRVSVIVPSRDRLDLIDRVSEGVLQETDYPEIELVIVDNGSTEPAVLALYERLRADPRVRIEAYPHPFNFAAMVNAGARAASGDVLVLLNNDVAVLRPDWLDALVAQAARPEIGAVGAKLLYGDGRLQHAGVVVGLGGQAGHILRRRPADMPGHLGRMRVAHEVSAVTAACLAVARAKYEAVGGFDEAVFPIDFNDVDVCLRLAAQGWRCVWTPRAVLSHLESVSRGRPVGAARERFEREAAAFAGRWGAVIRHDPFYHPALSLTTFGEDLE